MNLSQTFNTIKKHLSLLTIGVLILVGTINLITHYKTPIARNSMVYANIAYNMIDYGDDFSIEKHSYNKALGFVFVSLPFVKAFDANGGLKITSFLVCCLWLFSLIPFYRKIAPKFNLHRRYEPLFIFLLGFNGLFIYQFISAYPDLMFGLGLLWAIYFLDRLASKDIVWFDGLLFSLSLLFSVWVKHNGFVIIIIWLVFFIIRKNTIIWIWKNRRNEFYTFLVSFAAVISILISAQMGHNFGLFNLGSNISNYTGGGSRLTILKNNLGYLAIYFGLTLNIFIPLLFAPKELYKRKEWYLILIVYLGSLIFYRGTWYNMRYYLSIAPFFILILMASFLKVPKNYKKVAIGVFTFINCILILSYNTQAGFAFFSPKLNLYTTDNLRLVGEQKEIQESIETINNLAEKEKYETLVFLSDYYTNADWHVWERSGLFNKNLKIKYFNDTNLAHEELKTLNKALIYDPYTKLEKTFPQAALTKVKRKVWTWNKQES